MFFHFVQSMFFFFPLLRLKGIYDTPGYMCFLFFLGTSVNRGFHVTLHKPGLTEARWCTSIAGEAVVAVAWWARACWATCFRSCSAVALVAFESLPAFDL